MTVGIPKGELVRFDAGQRRFAPYLNGLAARWVTFSRDKQSVAYVSYPDGKLWRMNVDGTNRVQLVHSTAGIKGLMWSPDGRWLSFISTLAGMRHKIFIMPAGGGVPTAISSEDRDQGVPSWSDDSTRLVFGDVPEVWGAPDGSERVHIYDINTKQFSTVPGSGGLWTARWSPDGRQIAAVQIAKPWTLSIYELSAQRWRKMSDAHHVENLSWSSNSQFIYYNTSSGTTGLHRVRVSDGRDELLTSLEGPNWFNDWSGLTPDDQPLLLRDLGTSEVYHLRLGRRFWD
jgi:Tol biopolymer transport system component